MSNLLYRPDIDGLRGVAILSVIGYHAYPSFFPGGFIGVDVFFVISGFLITSILCLDFKKNTFNLSNFYKRRIRRMFPSLIIVLFSVFIASWFVLLHHDYRLIGKHLAGGAGFVSNIILNFEGGYFDSFTELKPLLHLWSLGVEEQFYLFWPLFLIFTIKKSKKLLYFTFFIFALSFSLNIFWVQEYTDLTFYSPFTRLWELLLGGLLSFYFHFWDKPFLKLKSKWLNEKHIIVFSNILSIIGILLILSGIFLISKKSIFPGYWAILPTVGATCLIGAGVESWFNKNFLSSRLLVYVGLISYPLYLWHWPLLSFARIIEFNDPSLFVVNLMVIVSFVLAWATYGFIEKPLRFGKNPMIVYSLILSMAIVGALGLSIYFGIFPTSNLAKLSKEFEFKFEKSGNLLPLKYRKLWREDCNLYTAEKENTPINVDCFTPVSKKNQIVFVWGDSHAQHLIGGLVDFLGKKHIEVLQVASSACSPKVNVSKVDNFCDRSNQLAFEKIKELRPVVVLLAQRSDHNPKNYKELSQKLQEINVVPVIVGPTPMWRHDLYRIILRKYIFLFKEVPNEILFGLINDQMKIDLLMKEQFSSNQGVKYISLIDSLCNEKGCLTKVGNTYPQDFITFDYGHFSENGSKYIAHKIIGPKIINLMSELQSPTH